jgi:hypothetical protein
MAVHNHAFFDLNNRRQYPLAVADAEFPVEVISDLKISVPDDVAEVVVSGIFAKDKCLRIVFSVDNLLVATFSHNTRNLIKIGSTYPLESAKTGYAGFITLGAGVRQDCDYQGGAKVSEECLTRFRPSAIPYVGTTCSYDKLTGGAMGEVYLAGSESQLTTGLVTLPTGLLPNCETALAFQLTDNLSTTSQNPMVAMANGINALTSASDTQSPIFTINNVRPDSNGVIRIHFEQNFKLTTVVDTISSSPPIESETPEASAVAVGTEIMPRDVCNVSENRQKEKDEALTPDLCDLSGVTFTIISAGDEEYCPEEVAAGGGGTGGGGGGTSTGCAAPATLWLGDGTTEPTIPRKPLFMWLTRWNSVTKTATFTWHTWSSGRQYQVWYSGRPPIGSGLTSDGYGYWKAYSSTTKNNITFSNYTKDYTPHNENIIFGVCEIYADGKGTDIEVHTVSPHKVTVTVVDETKVRLSWAKVRYAEKFMVYRLSNVTADTRTDSLAVWTKITEIAVTNTSNEWVPMYPGAWVPSDVTYITDRYTTPTIYGVCAVGKGITSVITPSAPFPAIPSSGGGGTWVGVNPPVVPPIF